MPSIVVSTDQTVFEPGAERTPTYAWPPAGTPEGTLFKAQDGRGRRPAWRGVVVGGEVVAWPRIPPDAPGGATDWEVAWEGPSAEAPWMLRQCKGVDPVRVVAAACAIARSALPMVPTGESRPLAAIGAAERWCREGAPTDLLSAAAKAARSAAAGRKASISSAAEAAGASADAAHAYAAGGPYATNDAIAAATAAAAHAANARAAVAADASGTASAPLRADAANAAERLHRRKLAETVREFIGLGAALAAYARRAP